MTDGDWRGGFTCVVHQVSHCGDHANDSYPDHYRHLCLRDP